MKTLCFDVKYFIEAVIYRRATVDVIAKNNTLAWQTISKALVWKAKAPLMSWKRKHLAIIHYKLLSVSGKVLRSCLNNDKVWFFYLWLLAEVFWSFCSVLTLWILEPFWKIGTTWGTLMCVARRMWVVWTIRLKPQTKLHSCLWDNLMKYSM